MPIFIDGSVNGLQHLTALSKDKEIAPFVNLASSELPGDLYTFVGEQVWQAMSEKSKLIPNDIKGQFWDIFEQAKNFQLRYRTAPEKSTLRAEIFAESKEWRHKTRKIREQLFPLYWLEISDKKLIRKICKRNVMTLG